MSFSSIVAPAVNCRRYRYHPRTMKKLRPAGRRSSQQSSPRTRLAADIGGTFTDIVAFDEKTGRLLLGKALSTPARLVDGISNSMEKAGARFADAEAFLHGSTIAINTMLERTGAKAALLTTEGFRDVYEIGRINRPDAYNLYFRKHVPLTERALRFEVRERITAEGEIHVALDEASVHAACDLLETAGVEAVAIMFLHSYVNPAHETRTREIVRERLPRAFVTASHELSREYREFERCSTVVANAYIGPVVSEYVRGIDERLKQSGFEGPFLLVQSTGGLYESHQARTECVRMLESGPACYALGGTRATVTDANLVLGRLGADRFLGGEMKLDLRAAEHAIGEHIAGPLGLDVVRAAEGILRIAATAMSYAVKAVSTERGLDAAAFTLIAYGGAGPLHASIIAREIGMRRVIVPRAPGHFCAFGMLFSNLRYDFVRTWFTRLADASFDAIEKVYELLIADGRAALETSGVRARRVAVVRAADMRYVGQEHPVTVELPAEVFRRGKRDAYFAELGRSLATPSYAREGLRARNRIAGPALIEEHASTTVLLPGDRLEVDEFGNLVIEVGRRTR